MANPYASVGSVATVTSSISGQDSNMNDFGGPSAGKGSGSAQRYSTGEVTHRLLSYVRPHAVTFGIAFLASAISVVIHL